MAQVPIHEDAAVHELLGASPARQAALLQAWGLPSGAILLLVNACESRCFFCAGPGTSDLPAGAATPRDRIETFFAELPPERPRLVIGGNDPWLHPDLELAVERAAEAGFRVVQLMTSGLSLEEGRLRRLRARGLRELVVPIYAASAAVHDAIVGRPAFARLVAGLDLAVGLGLRVHLHSLALRRNQGELAALAALCQERWGSRLAVAPLREKERFAFDREALPLDELAALLGPLPVARLGLPACVAPHLPVSDALAVELYFRTQRRGFGPGCAACRDRPGCLGVVEAALRTWGERGLRPRREEEPPPGGEPA